MSFTGTFGGTKRIVKAGDKLVIKFENWDLRGKKARIRVDNGKGIERFVDVEIDQNGEGTAEFEVPADWVVVKLNHDSAQEHAIMVAP